jgi:hypothetical protein
MVVWHRSGYWLVTDFDRVLQCSLVARVTPPDVLVENGEDVINHIRDGEAS